ncbi:helix-turn-helix domain-containing protein [Streptomyces sp. NPDC089799]|uniref:IclR family transcriptional regulator domain-containing protein n=1 Tax=Streptomyces sp. NPDC089799 TaxID=3155066 RepID=UPI00341A65C4
MARGLADFDPRALQELRWTYPGPGGKQGLTASDLARRAGASKAQIVAYENGQTVPDPRRVARLAAALNVEPARLMRTKNRKVWQVADLRRAAALTAAQAAERLAISAKAYRRFEQHGIVPARRAAFLDHVADRFGVELRVLDRAIDRIPAVAERQEAVIGLLRALREKYVERDAAWQPPDTRDEYVVELARLYGRTAHRVLPVISHLLAELRQREILIMREKAVAEYDTDAVRRARAAGTIAEHSRHFNREVELIPRRLEGFHRMGQPSDVWQALVDLYDLDAREGGPWVPAALLAGPDTAASLPLSLVRTGMFRDVAACRLTVQGVTHVRTFRQLYGALYPAVRSPIPGGQNRPRARAEHQFMLEGPERFAVPLPVAHRLLAEAELRGMGEVRLSPSTKLLLGPPAPGVGGRPRARTAELPIAEPPAEILQPLSWSALSLRAPSVAAAAQQAVALGGADNALLRQAQTAHRVVAFLQQHPVGVEIRRVERATGLAAKELGPLLAMLVEEEFATAVAAGIHAPGPALDRLASPGGVGLQLEHTLALARDTVGAAVYFARYLDGEVHITQMADGPITPRVHEWVDFKAAAHASAVGKCLLAQLPPDMRADHLSRHRTARLTGRTITDPRKLIATLDRLAPNQPVYDHREYATKIECGAIPTSITGDYGTLALSMPLATSHRLEEATQALARKAVPVLLALLLSGNAPTGNPPHSPAGPQRSSGSNQPAEPATRAITPAGLQRLRAAFPTPLNSPDEIRHLVACPHTGPHLAADGNTGSIHLFEAAREHPHPTDEPALELPAYTYTTTSTEFASPQSRTWQGHTEPDRILLRRPHHTLANTTPPHLA